ncbi:VOC family protein [Nocardioides sp. BP30]|uniref:VOC family protein n=1 Tax=Nocardioides sp. BP30 TaxID=3036374 RepID=UPI002469C07A|nr:VOC family protein [Nocardioides sp. BP30]WGL52782.1 VOC family protein [Nocardioides sp. BP30]
MALATYKDLSIDAVDAERAARFWAAALGLEAKALDDGDRMLAGPSERHAIWVNEVPEPVTVKQRVHLDIHAGSVDDVMALGASAVDLTSFRWKVLRDPEGGELCVFERETVPAYRLYEVVIDAREPERMATWWSDVLGARVEHKEGFSSVVDIAGAPFEALVFQVVPEPKTVKNRIHWDVTVEAVGLLLGDGATVLRPQDDEVAWTVLADPEGNEFCAFEPA